MTKTLERVTQVSVTKSDRNRGKKTHTWTLDDTEFILGEDTGEVILIHDHSVIFREIAVLASGLGTILERFGGVYAAAETEMTECVLRRHSLRASSAAVQQTKNASV